MKKLLALVLTLVLAMTCCSFAMAEEDVISATAIVFTAIGFPATTDNYSTKLIEEKYGLHLDVVPLDIGTDEVWSSYWAAGGYADIIIPYSKGAIVPVLEEDICRTIDFGWYEEYAPHMWELLLQYYGTPENIRSQVDYKGNVYCIPYFTVTANIAWVTAIRNDWLEAVNKSVPTSLEELTALLDAFTYGDPDGNGVDDTYAMMGNHYGLFNLPASFGTSDALYFGLNDDRTAVNTNAITDEYKAWLDQMAQWYAAGYIDPEFVTDDRAAIRSKFAIGKIGIYSDNPWWFEYTRGDVGPLQMVCANDSSVDFATGFSFMDNIPNADGEIYMNTLYGDITGQAAIYFGYDASDELVKRTLEFIDARTALLDGTEEDNQRQKNMAELEYGIEGTHWNWNAETNRVETTDAFNDLSPDERTNMGLDTICPSFQMDWEIYKGRPDEFCIDLYQKGLNLNRVYRSCNVSLPALSGELSDKYDLVSNCFSSFQSAVITGKKTIEADWDAYCEEIVSLGLNDVIAAYEEGLGL